MVVWPRHKAFALKQPFGHPPSEHHRRDVELGHVDWLINRFADSRPGQYQVMKYELIKTSKDAIVRPPYGSTTPMPRHLDYLLWEVKKIEDEWKEDDAWLNFMGRWFEIEILRTIHDAVHLNCYADDLIGNRWIYSLSSHCCEQIGRVIDVVEVNHYRIVSLCEGIVYSSHKCVRGGRTMDLADAIFEIMKYYKEAVILARMQRSQSS